MGLEGWGQGWHLEGVDVGDIGEMYREIQGRYREVYLEGVDVGDDDALRGAAAARPLELADLRVIRREDGHLLRGRGRGRGVGGGGEGQGSG